MAEHVASFVNFLRLKANLDPNDMKMIGHSLGAHVASLVARIVSQNIQVAEIVGKWEQKISELDFFTSLK